MNLLICVVFHLTLICDSLYQYRREFNEDWKNFKNTYKKEYSAQEELVRRYLWERSMNKILAHNKLFESGTTSFRMGINEFTDWSQFEFSQVLNCVIPKTNKSNPVQVHHFEANLQLSQNVDWRQKNVVTPVKRQGYACGSCWAFSVTGALEAQLAIKTGQLISLSVQQLIDCTRSYGNSGCKGGYITNSYEYIKDNGGIDSEESYPYEGKDKGCRFNQTTVANVLGYETVSEGNETALQMAVDKIGPVSAIVTLSPLLQHYRDGIFYDANCSSASHRLAVVVVGYGTENGTDYWLLKNSWGTSWGVNGYMKMAKNRKNQCDIASKASFPKIQ